MVNDQKAMEASAIELTSTELLYVAEYINEVVPTEEFKADFSKPSGSWESGVVRTIIKLAQNQLLRIEKPTVNPAVEQVLKLSEADVIPIRHFAESDGDEVMRWVKDEYVGLNIDELDGQEMLNFTKLEGYFIK